MPQGLHYVETPIAHQLGLYGPDPTMDHAQGHAARPGQGSRPQARANRQPPLCAACRSSEARYGFRAEGREDPIGSRPRTLCFECFRVEILRRQAIAARMARGWNGQQVRLPLDERLRRLDRQRRRAQIAARHALGLT
jgi:hypothetical protein